MRDAPLPNQRRRPVSDMPWLYAPLYIACSVFVYWNALTMDFIGDDVGRIVTQQHYFQKGMVATLAYVLPDRPFLMMTIWLNFKLGGIDPIGYKIVNVILHGCVAFFIWKLIITVFGHRHSLSAFLIPLVFIVHPIHNQSINSIIQRGVIFSALGILLSILLFIAYRQYSERRYYLLSFLCFLLALLSKQNAIILPILLMIYVVIFERRSWTEALKLVSPFFALFLIPILFYFFAEVNAQQSPLSWYEYLSIQARVIFLYFKLFALPFDLHFSHVVDPNPQFFQNFTWLAAIGHVAIGFAIFMAWKMGQRQLCFSAISMYLCFLPESGFFPITDLAFEHRTYLPFIFLELVLFWAITRLERLKILAHPTIIGLSIFFFLENASYNNKIKTYEKWVLYNVSQNPNDRRFNVYALDRLFLQNKIETGKHVSSILGKTFPHDPHYRLFEKMYAYEDEGEVMKKNTLQEFIDVLSNEKQVLSANARLSFNRFVMLQLPEVCPPLEVSTIVDDLVFSQLQKFRKLGTFFNPIYIHYAGHIERLLRYYGSFEPETLDHEQTVRYVRVMVVSKLYYNDDVHDLEVKFSNALKTFPKSKELKNLSAWYQSESIDPFPLPRTPLYQKIEAR